VDTKFSFVVRRVTELGASSPKEDHMPDVEDAASEAKEEAAAAVPDVPSDPGTEDGDLNAAGSEPEGRGE